MNLLADGASELDVGAAIATFRELGYARLGRVLSDEGLEALRRRADDVMLGRVPTEPFFYQIDTESGRYDDLTFGKGYEGPSLNYRKIEKLERDPVFLAWIENALFERIARTVIEGDVALYRATLFNKAASGGTVLPWHQDGGVFWGLDKDPELQIWTALDDVPFESGPVEVIPKSHTKLATPLGGRIPPDVIARAEADERAVPIAAAAGEGLLLHNYLWHKSGTNRTRKARRAFTVCYMSAATRCLRKKRAPRTFTRVFGT